MIKFTKLFLISFIFHWIWSRLISMIRKLIHTWLCTWENKTKEIYYSLLRLIFLVLFPLNAQALVPSLNVNISGNWSITIQRCCFEFQEFFSFLSHWHPQFLFSPSVGRRTLLLKNCMENYAFIYRIPELRKSWVRPAKAWKDRQVIITSI